MNGQNENTCVNCRHHAKQSQRVPMRATGRGDQIKFEDAQKDAEGRFASEGQTVYLCRASEGPYAGRTVGIAPVHCAAWAPASTVKSERLAELDRLAARFDTRDLDETKR